jgi:hypothetical protein
MEWEDGVALQLDVTQWTAGRMGPRGGLHAVERGDTFFARVVIEVRFIMQINPGIFLQGLRKITEKQ